MSVEAGAQHGAQRKSEQARHSAALETLARLGFGAYGVVYLVLAWLTVQLLLAHRSRSVSRQGALHTVAQQPLGTAVLWVASVGFMALVVWQACNVVAGDRDKDGAALVAARVMSGFRGVVFATLTVTTAKVALGRHSSGHTQSWTARLMGLPLGPALVAAVGVGIVVYAGYSAFRGITDRWRKELEYGGRGSAIGPAITVLARVGYVGRGVAFGVIGALFVWAAATHDPHRSAGLDGSLEQAREAPFGVVLLVVIALGFTGYGAFNLAKAWALRTS